MVPSHPDALLCMSASWCMRMWDERDLSEGNEWRERARGLSLVCRENIK